MEKRRTYKSKMGFIIDYEYGKRCHFSMELFKSMERDVEYIETIFKHPLFPEKEREESKAQLEKIEQEIKLVENSIHELNENFKEFLNQILLEKQLNDDLISS